MDTRNDVEQFMLAADQEVHNKPTATFSAQTGLYMNLIAEEYQELEEAFECRDLVEMADACADLIWVIQGLCHSTGIPLQAVWDEVCRSNLSKISESGKIIKREDGKVLKPATYSPPNIKPIISNNR